jgi:hypothetical protein
MAKFVRKSKNPNGKAYVSLGKKTIKIENREQYETDIKEEIKTLKRDPELEEIKTTKRNPKLEEEDEKGGKKFLKPKEK